MRRDERVMRRDGEEDGAGAAGGRCLVPRGSGFEAQGCCHRAGVAAGDAQSGAVQPGPRSTSRRSPTVRKTVRPLSLRPAVTSPGGLATVALPEGVAEHVSRRVVGEVPGTGPAVALEPAEDAGPAPTGLSEATEPHAAHRHPISRKPRRRVATAAVACRDPSV